MNTKQLYDFFCDKKETPCPYTDELIKRGYQQDSDGYIQRAIEEGLEVDYRKALPSQWWHLIKSYCKNTSDDKEFPRSIRCGELYFWMAEVSGVLDEDQLKDLTERAINVCPIVNRRNNKLPPLKTADGNIIIRDECYSKLKKFFDNK